MGSVCEGRQFGWPRLAGRASWAGWQPGHRILGGGYSREVGGARDVGWGSGVVCVMM